MKKRIDILSDAKNELEDAMRRENSAQSRLRSEQVIRQVPYLGQSRLYTFRFNANKILVAFSLAKLQQGSTITTTQVLFPSIDTIEHCCYVAWELTSLDYFLYFRSACILM